MRNPFTDPDASKIAWFFIGCAVIGIVAGVWSRSFVYGALGFCAPVAAMSTALFIATLFQ